MDGILQPPKPQIRRSTLLVERAPTAPRTGSLVLFGVGGPADDELADPAAPLAPLIGADADDLIRSGRAAPRLLGLRDTPTAELATLRDMLLRVSRMVEDLPQIAELELSPVIARPDGVQALYPSCP